MIIIDRLAKTLLMSGVTETDPADFGAGTGSARFDPEN